jgi:RHS repeat-associated protein
MRILSTSWPVPGAGGPRFAERSAANLGAGTMQADMPMTDAVYYRARYYDPNIGRFISEDPLRFLSGKNNYVYVLNRPLIAKDPSGLFIYICSRSTSFGVGNHAFLWDDLNNTFCGMGNSASENPNAPGTHCTLVAGSQGFENSVMECCNNYKNSGAFSMWMWRPGFHDCHTLAGDCLAQNGLANPGAPGGRLGCRGCGDSSSGNGFGGGGGGAH